MSQLSRRLPLFLGLLCSGALGFAALSARSQTPAPSASAAASGSPAAAPAASGDPSASPSGSPSAKEPQNVLRGADIPTEISEAPNDKKDWDPAKVVQPNKGQSACVFKVLREWLRMECQPRIGGALIAGEPADVKIWAWGQPFAAFDTPQAKLLGPPPMTVIVMPLRRGDAKVFALELIAESGWDWVGPESAERISIVWREGAADPVLIISRSGS